MNTQPPAAHPSAAAPPLDLEQLKKSVLDQPALTQRTMLELIDRLSDAESEIAQLRDARRTWPLRPLAERVELIAGSAIVRANPEAEEDLQCAAAALRIPMTPEPVPMVLRCPRCSTQHVDEDEWQTRPHRTHRCGTCGFEWRPANVATVGVMSLQQNGGTAGQTSTSIAQIAALGNLHHAARSLAKGDNVSAAQTIATTIELLRAEQDTERAGCADHIPGRAS
jgi:rubredoxin